MSRDYNSKFLAPQLDSDLYLARPRLHDRFLTTFAEKRIRIIEARAGQGKSVLVAQSLLTQKAPCCWYQVGPEDNDPIAFLVNLHDWLTRTCSGYHAEELQHLIEGGDLLAEQQPYYFELILAGLGRVVGQKILVFDDLYFINNKQVSRDILGGLVAKAPQHIRFVLISRHDVVAQLALDVPPTELTVIGNEELAFTSREIADYFLQVEKQPLTDEIVATIRQASEGWIMGVLLAKPATKNWSSAATDMLRKSGQQALIDYFLDHGFAALSPGLQKTLQKLSLLNTIPVELAHELTEIDATEAELERLARNNFFLSRLGEDRTLYRFHHLFHSALSTLAAGALSEEERRDALNRAGQWHQRHAESLAALGYFLDAGNYRSAESVLREFGSELNEQHRIVSLAGTLGKVPAAQFPAHPWLAYFQGIVTVNADPPAALAWFEQARQGFVVAGERLGELLSLTEIIHFRMVIDSRYNMGRVHLQRADDLFTALRDRLTRPQTIHAANMLLLGYSLFNNDPENASRFYDTALPLAVELDLKNVEAETRLARCFRNIFTGNHPRCRKEIEQSLGLLASPRVSMINKAMLLLGQLNLLTNEAEYDFFTARKALCRKLMGSAVFDESILGAYVALWDIDRYCACGDTAAARNELENVLGGPFAYASAHLRSQYLQYHAYLLACDGRENEALATADESIGLRAEVGCPFFETFNAALIGATYAQLGQIERADALFTQGLEQTGIHGGYYSRPTLLAHRSYWRLSVDNRASLSADLRELLEELKLQGFRQLWLCTPQMMERLLVEAVRRDIETDYARRLASDRYDLVILDDGTTTPLLHVNTLGRFEISLDRRPILQAADLTVIQRQLFALLLTAPNHELTLDEAQLLLWPDSAPAKTRSSLDTLIFRLRKTFATALGDTPVRHYLTVKRGMLRLHHCRCDYSGFRTDAAAGLRHLGRQEYWQGENFLRRAFALWQGEFMPGVLLGERGEQLRHDLQLLGSKAALKLAHLLGASVPDEARQVAEHALHCDATNEELVRCLYNLYAAENDLVNATRTIDRYSRALDQDGFSAAEIESILEQFWQKAS
jgi:DNA-binding SARP family transcriptional activator